MLTKFLGLLRFLVFGQSEFSLNDVQTFHAIPEGGSFHVLTTPPNRTLYMRCHMPPCLLFEHGGLAVDLSTGILESMRFDTHVIAVRTTREDLPVASKPEAP